VTGVALGYLDYVKAAFRRPVRLPLLGRMPLNPMALTALGVLGLANPGFWFLGAAFEIGYLGLLASSARFQKLVQGERLLERQQGFEGRVQATHAALSPAARVRYLRLLSECGKILGIAPGGGEETSGTLDDQRAGGLNQLLWLFLRLLASRETISSNIDQVGRVDVEREVADVRERLERAEKAEQDSALARSLQATLDIQQKRLDNLVKARKSLEVIDAELERIEQQVNLIREETAVSGNPELLSARLDAVTDTLGETSSWVDQNAEFLGSFGAEADDVAAASLPRLPVAVREPAAKPPPSRTRQRG